MENLYGLALATSLALATGAAILTGKLACIVVARTNGKGQAFPATETYNWGE